MSYLIPEYPLILLPRLAVAIGLNEAIVLQQLHYWLTKSRNVKDDKPWVYNTVDEWAEQFPFWSRITVERTLGNLREKGLVVATSEYNQKKW